MYSADMTFADFALPDDFEFVVPEAGALPIECFGGGAIYQALAPVFAQIFCLMKTGAVKLRRRSATRVDPWKKPSSDSYQDYDLVAYVSGAHMIKTPHGVKRRFKVIISHPHLEMDVLPTDHLVIDGTEYPILPGDESLKKTPKAGTATLFWTAHCGIG